MYPSCYIKLTPYFGHDLRAVGCGSSVCFAVGSLLPLFVTSPFLCPKLHCSIIKRGKPHPMRSYIKQCDDCHISLLMIQTRPGRRYPLVSTASDRPAVDPDIIFLYLRRVILELTAGYLLIVSS